MNLNTEQQVEIGTIIMEAMNKRIDALNATAEALPFGGQTVVTLESVHRIVCQNFLVEVMMRIAKGTK